MSSVQQEILSASDLIPSSVMEFPLLISTYIQLICEKKMISIHVSMYFENVCVYYRLSVRDFSVVHFEMTAAIALAPASRISLLLVQLIFAAQIVSMSVNQSINERINTIMI